MFVHRSNIFCAISLILLTASVVSARNETKEGADDVTYTTKYDDLDIDEILHSDRLLLNYVNCLLEKGRCTPDGVELKKNLPDAIDNDCKKCSEKQDIGSKMVMYYLIDNKPDWWKELETKYNPSGSYKEAYLKLKANKSSEGENDSDDSEKKSVD
ncbi:ejaculatory bulb-specific protein 3-like [Arctopsyche grandis]|uniref:ejaculatory bulb-specific protein 3-like n=1 Tax=Arctopsyche grandis TaxID=121162 RepID=UPI00406D709A